MIPLGLATVTLCLMCSQALSAPRTDTVLFYSKSLGVCIDHPSRRMVWRPLLPWSHLEWRNCRLGQSVFNFSFHRKRDGLVVEMANLNDEPFTLEADFSVPPGVRARRVQVEGESTAVQSGVLYGSQIAHLAWSLEPHRRVKAAFHF